LFLIHGIYQRFSSRTEAKDTSIPVPDTSSLPVFSDNVLPSILVHLGIIDLSHSTSPSLTRQFRPADNLTALLQLPSTVSPDEIKRWKLQPPKDGPVLTETDAYILRASAIDACEQIVEEAHKAVGEDCDWLRRLTLTELDGWLWSGAKDRLDYRKLERFVLRDTAYF
jgi:hypothetical protein